MSMKMSQKIHPTFSTYIPIVEIPGAFVESEVLLMEPEINGGKS